jgi:hypothetical protein
MTPDPTLTRAADETAGGQPTEDCRPGEAASASQAAPVGTRRAGRRYNLERSRQMTMVMLTHLAEGIDGKLFSTAQDSVDKLKDPFLAMNRMQRELRRIIAQEERLDDEDAERVKRLALAGADVEKIDVALVEARRAARRDDLERSQTMTTAMIEHLAKGLSGLLCGAAHDSVEKLKDPFLAINRMQRELRRIIALAERLEEDDFERAERLAAEKAKAAKAAREAEIRREVDAEFKAKQDKKDAIHKAVRAAAEDAWDDDDADTATSDDGDDDDDEDGDRLENLLDDLFDDYDTYESYDGDPVEIVAKLCARLGLKPEPDPSAEPAAEGADLTIVHQARALELAMDYLQKAGWPLAPGPVNDGHGPPDG